MYCAVMLVAGVFQGARIRRRRRGPITLTGRRQEKAASAVAGVDDVGNTVWRRLPLLAPPVM